MEKRINEKYQEYFMGPVVAVKELEIIETYKDNTALVKMDGIEKHVRWSPFGGEFVMKPAREILIVDVPELETINEALSHALDSVIKELMNERVCRGLTPEKAAECPALKLSDKAQRAQIVFENRRKNTQSMSTLPEDNNPLTTDSSKSVKRQPAEYSPPRTDKLNTWAKPDEKCIILHTGSVPSEGEVIARVYSNGNEAKRFAAANIMHEALLECHRVIQAHLADPLTLAGREGMKAMNMTRTALAAASPQVKKERPKQNSTGMER